MSEKFRHEVDTHACEDSQRRKSECIKSNTVVSFDHQKGYYSLGSSGLNLDYWFKASDEVVTEDSPNPDSYSHREEVMEEYGTDNWCSDDEETLQTYSEMVKVPSLGTAEDWGHHEDDIYDTINHNHIVLDVTTEDDIRVTDDSTNSQLMTIREEQTKTDPLPYTVVLPYTGISRDIKGAGVGLTIHGGLSYNQRLVSVVTEVEYTGPGFMLGNLTAGCIIYEWNGMSLLDKTHEQAKGILSQRIPSNELSLLVCNSSETEMINLPKMLNIDTKSKEKVDYHSRRRQSVISCSSQRQWVFEEENFVGGKQNSLEEIEPIEQSSGFVQISTAIHNQSKLQVTLHQGKLSSSIPLDPLASITLIGEELCNPDELLMSQVSIILSQTINPVWNHKFKPMKLPGKQLSCTGLHLIIWDCKSDDQYDFVGEVFLNVSAASQNTAPIWYSLASHDPNLPQPATPIGVKKRATINKFFNRVLSTNRVARSLNPKQDLSLKDTSVSRRKRSLSLFQILKSTKRIYRKSDKDNRMLVMRPKVSVINESTSANCDSQDSYRQQLPPSGLNQQVQQHSPFTNYSSSERAMEVEAVVEPHTYQPAWGLETEVHKKPSPDLHGFEVRQEQLGSPSSSGHISVHQSDTSSTNRNSGFSNYSTSSTESPDVMWHEVNDEGVKCSTMIRRSCSMSSFPVMGSNSSEYEDIQKQPSQANGAKMKDFPSLKPAHRSKSVEILLDTDSSTELSQTDASCSSSQEEVTANGVTSDQRPENLIMSFKMKYSAVQQPSGPQKSRVFFIKAKKIKAPFRLFRSKHASDSSHANKSLSSTSIPCSPEGSKVCLTQQRKELGIGQFIPKLDHLQEPCGRIRFSLVQHRRLLLKIRTVEERAPAISANECSIKVTLVQGKELICKKKVSTTLNSATNPLAEMYLDSHGCTDRMHLHIVITKGSRLSKKYVGEVWVNMKWADLSGLSSWYQLYT